MDQWYVRTRGRIIGPFGEADIRTMRSNRQLQGFDEISQDQVSWEAIDLSALFPKAVSVPTLSAPTTYPGTAPPAYPRRPRRAPLLGKGGWIIAGGTIAASILAVVVVALLAGRGKKATTTDPNALLATVPNGAIRFGPDTTAADRDKVLTSSVGLIVVGQTVKRQDGSQYDIPESTGTGFVVTPDGYLVTNKHVVESFQNLERADLIRDKMKKEKNVTVTPKLWVFFGRNDKNDAELVHSSEDFDLAIIKVKRACPWHYSLCSMEDTSMPVLDPVFAVGFPDLDRGEMNSKNAGSGAVQSIFPDSAFNFSRQRGNGIKKAERRGNGRGMPEAYFLRHSAKTSYGNSGGPLMTGSGQVIGINTQIDPETILKEDKKQGKLEMATGNFNNINFALTLHQIRTEIDKHVSGVVWQPLAE